MRWRLAVVAVPDADEASQDAETLRGAQRAIHDACFAFFSLHQSRGHVRHGHATVELDEVSLRQNIHGRASDRSAGAILAGLILGVFESLSSGYLDPYVGGGSREVAAFLLLLFILVVKPYGLFGLERIERL